MCRWHHPNGRKWRETKWPLDEAERGQLKTCLKPNIQKTSIMTSCPITLWHIDGGNVETMTEFTSLGSKFTMKSDCSHEIKRCLLLGKKAMMNWDSILKSRDITLLTKIHMVKAMFFPVVMYGCESWTIKKGESLTIDALELWCRRRPLRVPWTARRSNQSILKEINPSIFIGKTDAEAGAPILWPPDGNSRLIGKDSNAGKDWGQEEKGTTEEKMAGHEFEQTPGDNEGQGSLACCNSWGCKELDTTEWLKNNLQSEIGQWSRSMGDWIPHHPGAIGTIILLKQGIRLGAQNRTCVPKSRFMRSNYFPGIHQQKVAIVWGSAEHKGYKTLRIIKWYLLTTKLLATEKWFNEQYSPRSGQWKNKRTP